MTSWGCTSQTVTWPLVLKSIDASFPRDPIMEFQDAGGNGMTSNAETDSAVAIIGLGLMGRSIAACLLSSGFRVTGVTDNLEASAGVPERIRGVLAEMSREGLLADPAEAVMERFRMTDDLKDVADAEIVFESVTEDLKLKQELLQELERRSFRKLHPGDQHLGNSHFSSSAGCAAPRAHPGGPLGRSGSHQAFPGDRSRKCDIAGMRRAHRELSRRHGAKNLRCCARRFEASSPTAFLTPCFVKLVTWSIPVCALSKTLIVRCAMMWAGGCRLRGHFATWT